MLRSRLYVTLWLVPALGACDASGVVTRGELSDLGREQIFSPLPPCHTLDFDTDGSGAAIAPGDVVGDAYADLGVELLIWRNARLTEPGLPVAFDGANPTGGDDDLRFPELHNLLISQEHFDQQDIDNGFVAEPDDDARGAVFELRFEQPVCVPSLTVLDIDDDEPPAKIRLYDAAGDVLAAHDEPPAGNGVRIDVDLPAHACDVTRMTVTICSSGAVDNIELCEACPGGGQPRLWYLDDDADGFGDPNRFVLACEAPPRYVDNDLDCDDTDDAISPDQPEQCDGVDNNCDGSIDGSDAIDAPEWYADADGDGFGDPGAPVVACEQPSGTSASDDDCDDGDPDVNPGAPEIIGDGIDNNCDGVAE